MRPKFKLFFSRHILENLGLLNIFGKSFGRILYLLLLAYFSYKLSIQNFAEFAIFWASLRMFCFYGNNNLHIIYFNKVRKCLTKRKHWPIEISSNITITLTLFCILTTIISFYLFNGLSTALVMVGCLICFIIIRNISEFAKVDNNLFLSIFIDDILFYLLFFILSIVSLNYSNDLNTVIYALLIASVLTTIVGLLLFVKKFKIKIITYKISLKHFEINDFKLGLNYTFLRGNEVLSNFTVRYLGQIYFGDLFVAYSHIMYQFYNIFSLLTMSTISGFQSKITVKITHKFTKEFINLAYKKIQKTLLPFAILMLIMLSLFSNQILYWFFPKFVSYDILLLKVGFAGIAFTLIQPLVFILVYNNKFINIKKLNFTQYFVMVMLFSLPYVFPNFNQHNWLLLVMVSFVLVQGLFAWLNYTKIK